MARVDNHLQISLMKLEKDKLAILVFFNNNYCVLETENDQKSPSLPITGLRCHDSLFDQFESFKNANRNFNRVLCSANPNALLLLAPSVNRSLLEIVAVDGNFVGKRTNKLGRRSAKERRCTKLFFLPSIILT